ncbi:MAG: NAD-binding protein [Pseudomonadota bacterium]|nr:NAD-binding protein [Pseudomonadota bacterium]
MTAKLALFGCNPLAIEVAWRLTLLKTPFVMFDRDPERVEHALQEGLVAECIDYTDDGALRAAGIGSDIGGVFCLLTEDSENVFLAISARAIAPELRIVAVCQAPEAAPKLLAAGADKVVDPYEISGARVHELIERPEVVELMEHTVFGLQDLNIAEITIPPGAWLHSVHLSELRRHMTQNVILLGVVDLEHGRDLIFSTRGIDHKLDHGDVLVVIGPQQHVAAFRTMIESPQTPGGAA